MQQGLPAEQSTCEQGSRSPAGPRRLGTATCISTSLSRRPSAFFESAPGQDPKAAQFAVLPPGHAGFPKRVKQSEGSNSTPSETPPVSACKPLCAIFLGKPSVYPLSPVKANVGHLCEKLKSRMKNGWGIKFMAAALPDFPLLLVLRVHREPGNVCVAEYKVFRWRHKAALWSREGKPLFRRVSRCVRSFSECRVCTRFRL